MNGTLSNTLHEGVITFLPDGLTASNTVILSTMFQDNNGNWRDEIDGGVSIAVDSVLYTDSNTGKAYVGVMVRTERSLGRPFRVAVMKIT